MANKEIDQLTTASLPLTGAEVFHVKQGANSREVSTEEMKDFAGRGGVAYGLGHARFTAPGDTLTAQNSSTPISNGFEAGTGHWSIVHNGDDGTSIAYQAVAAGDFDKVFVLSPSLLEDGSSTGSFGIFVGDGTNSSAVLIADEDPFRVVKNFFDTNRTTFVSSSASFTGDAGIPPLVPFNGLVYMRVTRVGTTITFYLSNNGFDWWDVETGTDTENNMASITELGIWFDTAGRANTQDVWLRLVGLDDGPQLEARSGGGTLPVAFKGFSATQTVGQSIGNSLTTVIYDNIEFDTEGGYDDTTGEYTVPASLDGKYMIFGAALHFGSRDDILLVIDHAGTDIARADTDTSNSQQTVSQPRLVTAGDVIKAEGFRGATATSSVTTPAAFWGMVIETSEDAFDNIEDSSTARTLTDADFKGNRTIWANNAAAITYTLDTGVTAVGPLTIIQDGAGAVTVSGTATIEGKGTATNGQGAALTIIPHPTNADEYRLVGDVT